ncbi:MAG: ABC transporter ATP-binding protein/permease [Rickettsiales bacterium]|jgi:ABC-type multidrug transport system fused ATPase/permease subunit|nr:ABC transporter ATP-binding protein/permease [Rickettsiales bacterium]
MQRSEKIPDRILPFFWFFMKKYKWNFLGFIFITSVVSELGFAFVAPFILKCLTDEMMRGALTFPKGMFLIFGYVFCDTSYPATILCMHLAFNSFERMVADIREKLFVYSLEKSSDFFNNNYSGELNGKINSIVNNIETLGNIAIFFCKNVLIVFGVAAVFFFYDKTFCIILTLSIALFLFLVYLSSGRVNESAKIFYDSDNELQGLIGDSFMNISTIKNFSGEEFEKKKLGLYLGEMFKKFKKFNISIVLIDIRALVFRFLLAIFLVINVVKIFLENKLEIGTLIFLLKLIENLDFFVDCAMENVDLFAEKFNEIKTGLTLVSSDEKILDRENAEDIANVNGKISFKNINFAYKNGG